MRCATTGIFMFYYHKRSKAVINADMLEQADRHA